MSAPAGGWPTSELGERVCVGLEVEYQTVVGEVVEAPVEPGVPALLLRELGRVAPSLRGNGINPPHVPVAPT